MSRPLPCSRAQQTTSRIPARLSGLAVCWLTVSALGISVQAAEERRGLDFFETKIRPVLVKHCYSCHSRDSEQVKGGLVLDSTRGMLQGGDSGPALKPGRADESLLIEALEYESFEMPPDGRLPAAVVKDFRKWIEMGAPQPEDTRPAEAESAPKQDGIDLEAAREFWAFQPPARPQPPTVAGDDWSRSAIDRFVFRGLKDHHFEPAPDADRRTLIRRLKFDLLGLPPTPDEIEEFVNDASPDAVEQLVDGYLQSRHFGEHWARYWLDVARYADSNGGDFNATFHNAWRYRNYVIDAFNEDKPFDVFIREQLAGDLLPYATDDERTEQLVATGFLMIGTKMLSERDKVKLRMDVVDEQIDTVGKSFLGLTMGCARCHDHKFDPIGMQDYYALAGIFRSTVTVHGEIQKYVSHWLETELPMSDELAARVADSQQRKAALTEELKTAERDVQKLTRAINNSASNLPGHVVDDSAAEKTGQWKDSTYTPRFVGTGYVHDNDSGKGERSITYRARLPEDGRREVRVSYTSGGNRAKQIPVTIEHAEGTSRVMLDQSVSPPIDGLFASLGTFPFRADRDAVITISNAGTSGYVIADAVQFLPPDTAPEPAPDAQAKTGDADSEDGDADAKDPRRAELAKLEQRVKELKDELKAFEKNAPEVPRAMAARDAEEIGDCPLCIRGEPHNLGSEIDRGFVRVLGVADSTIQTQEQSGRVQLADWIASPANPLTARVAVNRVWNRLIGSGIVQTVDNFGHLGSRPTHPELLDWLAIEFMERGWSHKHIIRQIVLSRTYQAATVSPHDYSDADPENAWLWRAHRRRLPAESIRDALLAISGQLDRTPQKSPVGGLGTLVTVNSPNSSSYEQKASHVRTIYTPIIRNELPPILQLFDFADPDLVTGQRVTTTVPAQALFLMNNEFVRTASLKTAGRILESPVDSDSARVALAYERVLGRQPTRQETDQALAFLASQPAASGRDDDETAAATARWSQLVQVLFASTEFRILN